MSGFFAPFAPRYCLNGKRGFRVCGALRAVLVPSASPCSALGFAPRYCLNGKRGFRVCGALRAVLVPSASPCSALDFAPRYRLNGKRGFRACGALRAVLVSSAPPTKAIGIYTGFFLNLQCAPAWNRNTLSFLSMLRRMINVLNCGMRSFVTKRFSRNLVYSCVSASIRSARRVLISKGRSCTDISRPSASSAPRCISSIALSHARTVKGK